MALLPQSRVDGGQNLNEVIMGYMEKVLKIAEEIVDPDNPQVHHVGIVHDDWCAIFKGKACNCNPDVRIINEPDS